METYIVKVSKSGSVTIPVKIRRQLGIRAGTKLEITVEKNSIVLKMVS